MLHLLLTLPCLLAAAGVDIPGRAGADATGNLLPNPEFRQGAGQPAGWTLQGEPGQWVEREWLELTGQGKHVSAWRAPVEFSPGAWYRLAFRGRFYGASNWENIIRSGPPFAEGQHRDLTDRWEWYDHVIHVPDGASPGSHVALGQWHAEGKVQFDAVRLSRIVPIHTRTDRSGPDAARIVLGDQETIQQGVYSFEGQLDGPLGPLSRPLVSSTAEFHPVCWRIEPDTEVVYRFHVPGHAFESAYLRLNLNWPGPDGCLVEISPDGDAWQPLAIPTEKRWHTIELPAEFLPANAVYVRLRGPKPTSRCRIVQVRLTGRLSGDPPEAIGATYLAELLRPEDADRIEQITAGEPRPDGTLSLIVSLAGRPPTEQVIAIDQSRPGAIDVDLGTADQPLPVRLLIDIHPYRRTDFGHRVAAADERLGLWWCEATRKVSPWRPLPAQPAERAGAPGESPHPIPISAAEGTAVRIEAAGNDVESFQLVLRPTEPIHRLTARATELRGPDGATIPADAVAIHRVWYHMIDWPTDHSGIRTRWGDALPPLDGPLDIPPGENQPLWIDVAVPPNTPPGDYSGHIELQADYSRRAGADYSRRAGADYSRRAGADGISARVPVVLRVWGFSLPAENHLETAFRMKQNWLDLYHNVGADFEAARRVREMYLKLYARHRISPQDPARLAPYTVSFLPDADPPRAELDFTAFDREVRRQFEAYHFTGIRLRPEGLGRGRGEDRVPGEVAGFREDTPEYEAMMSSYLEQLQEHLRERAWLDKAYIYWIDEPKDDDYPFARDVFKRLGRWAPDLRRMVTEEPVDALGGVIDLWCPLSFRYDEAGGRELQAEGAHFWWYVCTSPKAPYCALFTDHPATSLRVWHWQTWKRKIRGTLIWETTYWWSPGAYPRPNYQDPYADPMSWQHGCRWPFGNGDGRLIYPPLSARLPGGNDAPVNLDPPVGSIRLAMVREGIEDYEMLALLRQLIESSHERLSPDERAGYNRLLEVPVSISEDKTHWTTDPTPIYTHRRRVAEAIEALGRRE
jgi:hypothetical protein